MQKTIEKLKEIKIGEVGMVVFSPFHQEKLISINEGLIVPLASAAKVAIAFYIAKLVEEGLYAWDDEVTDIRFNPKEDSSEVYPHFQNRETLSLQDAVEVMIACHDSFVADCIVKHCGSWNRVNRKLKSYFPAIHITKNPRDPDNKGEIKQVFELLLVIYEGYKNEPELWMPIMNGFVRQRGEINGIPSHHFNHMTGGLDEVIVDMGIMGEFSKNPFLFVVGAKDLPNRFSCRIADEVIMETMKLLYDEYLKQEVGH